MEPGTVAITGANGFIAGRIHDHLLDGGVTTIGLVRMGRALPRAERPRREIADWNEQALSVGLEGVDVLVHAASVVHRPGAAASEYEKFNVDGTRALLAAARGRDVRHIVFLSSIKVYGEQPTGIIDETTRVDRSAPYSSTKLDAEQILLDAASNGGPSVTVLRLCPVYGAGDKGNVRRVAVAIARRKFAVPGDGSTRKSVVHASTVAEVVLRAVQTRAPGVFVLADRVAPSMRELGDTVAAALGRRSPPSVPIPLAMGAAAGLAAISRLRGREPNVSPGLIRKSLCSTVCSPARVEAAFDMTCHVDLRVGVAEEIAWMKSEGLL